MLLLWLGRCHETDRIRQVHPTRPPRPAGSRSPYQALLGEAFDTLHPNLRRAHEAPLNAQGNFDVVHGTHRVTGILVAEIAITLWDFIEEDRIRRLPAGERAMHSVMGIVYGAFLAYLVPEIVRWREGATGFGQSYHGFPAWVLSALAVGVFLSGVRDVMPA
jgi:hypothetical protein